MHLHPQTESKCAYIHNKIYVCVLILCVPVCALGPYKRRILKFFSILGARVSNFINIQTFVGEIFTKQYGH